MSDKLLGFAMAWIFYWSIFAVSQLITTYQYLTFGTTEKTFISATSKNAEKEITIDSDHYTSQDIQGMLKIIQSILYEKIFVSMMNSGIQLKQKLGLKENI